MGYKQPGFGNGKRATQVPDTSSPLNFLGGGKVKKRRESNPYTSKKTGVQMSQYSGTRFEGKRAGDRKRKAEKMFNKAQEDLAKGKKLSKRQQSFVDEHQYNVNRQKQQDAYEVKKEKEAADRKAKQAIYDKYGPEAKREYDAKASAQKAFSTPTHKGGIGNLLSGPGVEEAGRKAGAIPETDVQSVDVTPPKPQKVKKTKGYYADTKIMNPERTKRAGHRVDYTEDELNQMRFSQKPNKYGFTPTYNQKGEIEYHQFVPKHIQTPEQKAKWKAQMDKNIAQRDKDYEAQFGSDASKENRDYTMLEGYNTHTGRTRRQASRELREGYAAGTLSPGQMAYQDKVRKEQGFKRDKQGRYTIPPRPQG